MTVKWGSSEDAACETLVSKNELERTSETWSKGSCSPEKKLTFIRGVDSLITNPDLTKHPACLIEK